MTVPEFLLASGSATVLAVILGTFSKMVLGLILGWKAMKTGSRFYMSPITIELTPPSPEKLLPPG
jgi:hypothetical protein